MSGFQGMNYSGAAPTGPPGGPPRSNRAPHGSLLALTSAPPHRWQNRGFTKKGSKRGRRRRTQNTTGAEVGSTHFDMVAILSNKQLAQSICQDIEAGLGAYQNNAHEGGGLDPGPALSVVKSQLLMMGAKARFDAERFGNWRDVSFTNRGLISIRAKIDQCNDEHQELINQNNDEDAAYKQSEIDYLRVQEFVVLTNINEMASCFVANTTPNYDRIDGILKRVANNLHEIVKINKGVEGENEGYTWVRIEPLLQENEHLIDAAMDLMSQGSLEQSIDAPIAEKMRDILAHLKLLQLVYIYEQTEEYNALSTLNMDSIMPVIRAVRKMKDRTALYEVAIWSSSGIEVGKIRLLRAKRYIQRGAGLVVGLADRVSQGPSSIAALKEGFWNTLKTGVDLLKGAKNAALHWAREDPDYEPNTNNESEGGMAGQLLALSQELDDGTDGLYQASQELCDAIQDSQGQQYEDAEDDFEHLDQDVAQDADQVTRDQLLDLGPVGDLLPQVDDETLEYDAYARGAQIRLYDELAWIDDQGYNRGNRNRLTPQNENVGNQSNQGENLNQSGYRRNVMNQSEQYGENQQQNENWEKHPWTEQQNYHSNSNSV